MVTSHLASQISVALQLLDTCLGSYHTPWKGKVLFPGSTTLSRSVQCLVTSSSVRPHGLQHARLRCPSPTPRACSNSCPSSQLMPSNHLISCHPLIFLPSIFPRISQFFAPGGQSIGALASASALPMNIQD